MPATPYQNLYIYHLSGRLPYCEQPGVDFLGNWQEANASFLFFSSPADDQVETLVKKHVGLDLVEAYEMTYEEWQGTQIGPLTLGRFRMVPPWVTLRKEAPKQGGPMSSAKKSAVPTDQLDDIIFDPGVVFGNGLHPTTRDCLQTMETVWDPVSIDTVLDLGCGTGILSLAAARLGCQRVLAVDNNLLAVQTTGSNVSLNALNQRILAIQGDALAFVSQPADLLIANLHFDVMKRLVENSGFCQKPRAILSGLLTSEAKIIVEKIERQGALVVQSHVSEGKWYTFLVSRVDADKEGK